MTESFPLPRIAASVEDDRLDASLRRRLVRNPTFVISLLFLALLVLAAIFAPLLTTYGPNEGSLQTVLLAPGAEHVLGTDSAGRDVWTRLLYATRYSLAGAVVALVVAAFFGVTAGLIAGYYQRWFGSIANWTTGLIMALPAIVVLLAARAVLGPSLWLSMTIFGVIISPAFFRLVYSSVSGVRNELYVDAARVAGLSDARIVGRHIFGVVRAPIVIQAAMVAGIAIAAQAGLEFLGLGDLAIPTWGTMLNDGFTRLYRVPLLILWPSLAIALTCVALTLLASSMRDELEHASPRRRTKNRKKTVADGVATSPDASPLVGAATEPASAVDAPLLSVTNLSVGYERPDGGMRIVVDDVSLTIRRGEIHGLIGESGSGKTQTAWSILGLLPAGGTIVSGSIDLSGSDLTRISQRALTQVRGRRIAYVPQEPMSNLDPTSTVGSQVAEPMRACLGLSKAQARTKVLELLKRVGIPEPERTYRAYPHEISGGMAQRVLIARAISCDPELLIADEPTTALDATVQAEVLDLLRGLQQEMNLGVLLVTHNFGVVADLCDTVSVMSSGRIVETGPVSAVFDNPSHPYTRSLFDAILDDAAPRGPLLAADS